MLKEGYLCCSGEEYGRGVPRTRLLGGGKDGLIAEKEVIKNSKDRSAVKKNSSSKAKSTKAETKTGDR